MFFVRIFVSEITAKVISRFDRNLVLGFTQI